MKKTELTGLLTEEVIILQKEYGKNTLVKEKKENFFLKIIHIILEPMFLLLLVAAIIYFILGEPRDGIIMLVFVIGIIAIDVIQEWKTDKTLKALKDLAAPQITVLRNNKEISIASEDLVPNDIMFIKEGIKIPADGKIIISSNLRVNESSLTGEAEAVFKSTKEDSNYFKKNNVYAGSIVITGTGVIKVEKIGTQTEYGKIGLHISECREEKSALKKQTDQLVKICAFIALFLFILVSVITYFNLPDHEFKPRIIESILSGITLAMAMIPEEFPVVLTIFLSMGAWRLAKKNSLVKKLPSVETLGSISVLCVDKTGTITKNEMVVDKVWEYNQEFCETMGLCCEEDTYDPMEKAMLSYCEEQNILKDHLFGGKKIKEYAFTDENKMMGFLWEHDDMLLLASKGSLESILPLCNLRNQEYQKVELEATKMAEQGLRVIAVGRQILNDEKDAPKELNKTNLSFCGLVGLLDPPRESMKENIATCYRAGIKVVMITGDNGITASSIAKSIGMKNVDSVITGDMLNNMSDLELKEKVKEVSIFSRVIPEHKMRIVKAFQEKGEIVAMTGDGVNDAPALKHADIGIAMGKRGSEVSREAADLILMDDNFSTIVDTIKDGRRIYDNIKKAIGYIFVIHIPIALSSLLGPFLGITSSSLLLLPIHVVLLELLIDPTCSIVLERGPSEDNIMERYPRKKDEKLLTSKRLMKSILQGFIIFLGSFLSYYGLLKTNAEVARTVGLMIIILSNLFLVQVNSSDTESVIHSMRKLKKDKVMYIIHIGTIAAILLILYTPLHSYLKLSSLSLIQLGYVVFISFIGVYWYEIVKWIKRNH